MPFARPVSGLAAGIAALSLLSTSLPAAAQQASAADLRLQKAEAEIRALQRKVFTDGAGHTLPADASTPAEVTPAASAATVSELSSRMDAVEAQLRRLTAASEENGNRIAKIEARLAALATPAPGSDAHPSIATDPAPAPAKPAPAAKPDPARAAALKAVVKPASGDAGEDDYMYGYNLWSAKLYPEAETQLKKVVTTYPKHKRISYARNLLGRAYLDDDKPGTAAQWFVQNYTADKAGDRAPDSLLYLAQAMVELKEVKHACAALKQLSSEYPAAAGGRLKGELARTRSTVTCN